MKLKFFYLVIVTLLCLSFQSSSFKKSQLRYKRVRNAYAQKGKFINQKLNSKQIKAHNLRLYLRAFKTEKKLEVWAKNKNNKQFKHLITYDICNTCGTLGPKRKEGDMQIPEGYYHINRFNPFSNYHLSLGINYPNRSDKILSHKKYPGGNIFIHGSWVTIGCLPISDDKIKELYILCIEAKNSGQKTIPITIFPNKMHAKNFNKLKKRFNNDYKLISLWKSLKKGYDIFNKSKKLPNIRITSKGEYIVSSQNR